MKSTKYQLLEADFKSLKNDIRLYRETIERLKKEKEQAYHDGYKQGRFDEQMNQLNK